MKTPWFRLFATLATCLLFAAAGWAQSGSAARMVVRLSHPSLPATLKVDMVNGNLTVRTHAQPDVAIASAGNASPAEKPAAAPPGMRVIDSGAGGVQAHEHDNFVTVTVPPFERSDLTVWVPVGTSLNLRTVNGVVTIGPMRADVDATSVNGGLMFDQVAGSIVAHTVNGKITASIPALDPHKPSSFTSFNGVIDVTLPAAIRATLHLQSDHGKIYLDDGFTLQPLTSREMFEADAARGPTGALGEPPLAAPVPPVPPVPPSPAVPPGSRPLPEAPPRRFGGVNGTLNGGGTEIRFQEFNGSIYIHQAK